MLFRSSIRGFTRFGVGFGPTNASKLYVTDSIISNNGAGVLSTDAGLIVQPFTDGAASVHISRVRLTGNLNGIVAIGTTSTAGLKIAMDDSLVSGNNTHGVVVDTSSAGSTVNMTIAGTQVSGNFGSGLRAQSSTRAILRVGNSMITANATGISTSLGGQVRSFGDNQVVGNSAGETFSGVDLVK